ncbi:mucin-5AC-like [Branchiostoma floridae]|uniref:Mucin-5AC-like n=1 Tax=Branchiostoma floridae TaxID=7739 RepID=A0A9J7LVX7_BRAFL|nr:mucin-5AC-like [Branchiostoma floridae]
MKGFECFARSCESWTRWFNRDHPGTTGDWEVLSHLRPENPGQICRSPTDIQARVISTGQDAFLTGEVFASFDVTTGFVCRMRDQPDGTCLDYEVRFCCPIPDCPGGSWTTWFDRDNPGGVGDWEALVHLRPENPGQICSNPTAVHARVISTQVEASLTGQVIHWYDTTNGFACVNRQQNDGDRCLEYEVRFCCPPCTNWTPWFDRDNPGGGGDWEVLSHLRPENPGQICRAPTDIQARVISTGQDAFQTGEVFAFYDVTSGFACRAKDQPDSICLDYEVRFCCPLPDCPDGSWTPWFDRDNPSATGDWEALVHLRPENPGQICFNPTAVHARVISTQVEASLTGQVIHWYDTTNGFACVNRQQNDGEMCLEYEVRFCCPPCTNWTPWFDRDNPGTTGDWEVLSHLRPENPGQICRSPTDIQARVIATGQDAFQTGEVFAFYDVTTGFVCRMKDQPDGKCLDYEVRFCCPRKYHVIVCDQI